MPWGLTSIFQTRIELNTQATTLIWPLSTASKGFANKHYNPGWQKWTTFFTSYCSCNKPSCLKGYFSKDVVCSTLCTLIPHHGECECFSISKEYAYATISRGLRNSKLLASFPGPAQLSVTCSTEKRVLQATESWAGPGNEATKLHLKTQGIPQPTVTWESRVVSLQLHIRITVEIKHWTLSYLVQVSSIGSSKYKIRVVQCDVSYGCEVFPRWKRLLQQVFLHQRVFHLLSRTEWAW